MLCNVSVKIIFQILAQDILDTFKSTYNNVYLCINILYAMNSIFYLRVRHNKWGGISG